MWGNEAGGMEIQIIVPWGTQKIEGQSRTNIGEAYNRLMKTVDDWVCFLDHDILQLNPSWYYMCLSAIERVGHTAGWITGVTNAIACPNQLCADAPKNQNIEFHMKFAKQQYKKFGDHLHLIDPKKCGLEFSGFMILTHKQAWEKTGGFMDGFLGVDNNYFRRVTGAGYKTYVMPGLYMYHTYGLKKLWGQF